MARLRLLTIALAAVVIAVSAAGVAAQDGSSEAPESSLPALPPALLRQLEGLAQPPQSLESNVRGQARAGKAEDGAAPGKAGTSRAAPAPAPSPTALERDFSARAGEPLRLYGRDAFAQGSDAAPATGAIRDSYVLGFGDELRIEIRGEQSRSLSGRVGRDGLVLLPGLPPVPAAARSFGEFRGEMIETARRALGNVDVFVSLGAVHQIAVLVTGAVQHPGPRRLDAFATLLNAIGGELAPEASLRGIAITHAGVARRVDLYGLVAEGRTDSDLALSDGDQVFVPTLRASAAVAGEVLRPAIFELADATSAAELLRLAGGYVRPAGNRVLRISLDADGRDRVTEIGDLRKVGIRPGDILRIERSENIELGAVRLDGNVRVPGPRATSAVRSLRRLLDPDQLNVDPYLPFVVVITTDPQTQARRLAAFDVSEPGPADADPPLRTGDTVIVLGRDDIGYLSSPEIQHALAEAGPIAGGEPHAGAASPDRGASAPPNTSPPGECPGVQSLAALAAVDRTGRFAGARAGSVAETAPNPPACPTIYSKYPDLLPFALEHAVSVEGEVRRPGIYPVVAGARLSGIARAAGGVTRTADLRAIEVSRFSVEQRTGRSDLVREELSMDEADFSKIVLSPGDAVRFNPLFNERDDGPVALTGEFRRPGRYDIRRGDRLSSLYPRAGGLTQSAYPYGAVLRRVRVREAEEEARDRTIRDLQIELGRALQGSSADRAGQAAAMAQQALATLQSAPSAGRVVFEADPAMLELHPELDIVLEPGDQIYMPKRPGSVTIAGDVLNPSTQQFRDGLSASDYIRAAGGFVETADQSRVFVILPNGQAEPAGVSFWNVSHVSVPPGSTIVVPRELSGDTLDIVRDIATALGQTALTAASIAVISR